VGLRTVRVRLHPGELARIEVQTDDIARLVAPDQRAALVEQFRALGFNFVTVELAGFQSGSMNRVLPKTQPGPE